MGKIGGIIEVLLGVFLLGAGLGFINDSLNNFFITILEVAAGLFCIFLGLLKFKD